MRSLLKVELTRLRWRRAVLVMLLGAVVAPLLIAAGVLWDTRPVSDADIARAKEDAQYSAEMSRPAYDDCVADPSGYGVTADDDPASACRDMVGYYPDSENWQDYLYRSVLNLPAQLDESASAVAAIVVILAILLGTTFVGADWASGSMSNQLLFEPRRTRVWWAKGITVALAGAVLTLLGLVVFWAVLGTGAALRDVSVPGSLWGDVAGHAGRAMILGAAAALAGFALTMFFRSTVATLGVVVVVTALSSLIVGLMPIADPIQWQPTMHALAFLQNGFDYTYWPSNCWDSDCGEEERTISMLRGSLFLGTLVLAAVAASLASFRRRDVP
ncbi:ABC transporter permease subunit [Nocardioides dubius]|uniref:ABC transporter permease n=1 Tax=Nocardioides dubius TaxID=317019 RepID=A0ABN1TQ02_9ACTN